MLAQSWSSSCEAQLSSSRMHEESEGPIHAHYIDSGAKVPFFGSSSTLEFPVIPLPDWIVTSVREQLRFEYRCSNQEAWN